MYCHKSNTRIYSNTFGSGCLDMISLEVVGCGRPVTAYVSSRPPEYERCPLKAVKTKQKIAGIIQQTQPPPDLWENEHRYFKDTMTHELLLDTGRIFAKNCCLQEVEISKVRAQILYACKNERHTHCFRIII